MTRTTFPNSVDTIPDFQNITSADSALVTQYENYIEQGNFASAANILNQIPNGNLKLIGADRIGVLRDGLLALQQFYGTDVQPYIMQKQAEWEAIIDLFSFVGEYNSTLQYSLNNFVLFNNNGLTQMYINIYNGVTPSGIPPTNTNYWRAFTIRGAQGISGGSDTTFMFSWNSSTNYVVNNIVVSGNAWWIATQNSTNVPPAQGSAYWNLVLNISQEIYPIQSSQPVSQLEGEIWFRVV